MNFEANSDQATFFAVLDQMIQNSVRWKPAAEARFEWAAALDEALDCNEFYNVACQDTLGSASAAFMVYELSRSPVVVECTASAMLRPRLGIEIPRPLAVLSNEHSGAVRFLPLAETVVRIGGDGIFLSPIAEDERKAIPSLFAYPMGQLRIERNWSRVEVDPQQIADLWRVGIAAEIAGVLQGGFEAVLDHVKHRAQFGRALGSFQAVQHRLAACATMIQAARWLALKAAQTADSADAVIATGYAQSISTKVIYDLHQFMGAMGLTLEHPLHRWTYRARLLRSELGGAEANFDLVAERLWRTAA